MANHKSPVIPIKQGKAEFYLTKIPAGLLTRISYASVRNKDDEVGAVQRLLNPSRISSVRDFTLAGGTYPACVILNWVDSSQLPRVTEHTITIGDNERSAQIIDGQHRVAGLQAAIEKKPSIAKMEMPIALFIGLDTQGCADLFLSINTKQKQVQKSLVFDLFELASSHIVDAAAERATDLARTLNDDDDSPYFERIKLPNAPANQRGIALSTVVDCIKPIVDDVGVFEKVGLVELEMQTRAIINYFNALRDGIGSQWDNNDNAMLYASGFIGSIEFFRDQVVPHCNIKRSFTVQTIRKAFRFKGNDDYIKQTDLKGLQGRAARNKVFQELAERFESQTTQTRPFEV